MGCLGDWVYPFERVTDMDIHNLETSQSQNKMNYKWRQLNSRVRTDCYGHVRRLRPTVVDQLYKWPCVPRVGVPPSANFIKIIPTNFVCRNFKFENCGSFFCLTVGPLDLLVFPKNLKTTGWVESLSFKNFVAYKNCKGARTHVSFLRHAGTGTPPGWFNMGTVPHLVLSVLWF